MNVNVRVVCENVCMHDIGCLRVCKRGVSVVCELVCTYTITRLRVCKRDVSVMFDDVPH